MRRFRLQIYTAILALLSACHVGPQIDQIHAARLPAGASVLIEIARSGTQKKQEYAGELLEVRDDGLVVALRSDTIRDTHIAFVSWNIVYRVKATTLPGIQSTTPQTEMRRENAIKEFRIVSRYPQGLSPELLNRLLASFDQKAMDIIEI